MTEIQDVPVRCLCARRPILAIARTDVNGKWYLHVRAYKRDQLITEVVCDEGSLRVRCRECLMWHKINLVHKGVDRRQERLPDEVVLPPFARDRSSLTSR